MKDSPRTDSPDCGTLAQPRRRAVVPQPGKRCAPRRGNRSQIRLFPRCQLSPRPPRHRCRRRIHEISYGVNTPWTVEIISLDGSRRFYLLSRREKRNAFPKRKFRQRISASANHGLAPNINLKEIMNTSIQHPELKGIVQPSGDSSRSEATLSAWRKRPGRFTFTALLAGLFLLLFSAPAAHAQPQGVPPGCIGSGLGIFLDTPSGDSHVGCTICYSITVLNGGIGSRVYCDASNIAAFVVTPDTVVHSIPLATLTTTSWEGGTAHPGRTYLSNGQYDYYTNVVCYTIRTNDIFSDGTVRATARDIAVILQNDTPSSSTDR